MTDLSPAAKAVRYAATTAMPGQTLSAALRAAALYCERDRAILLSLADELDPPSAKRLRA